MFKPYFYKHFSEYKSLIQNTNVKKLTEHMIERISIINQQEMSKTTWSYYRNLYNAEQEELGVIIFKFYGSLNSETPPYIKMDIIFPTEVIDFLTILLILEKHWIGKYFTNLTTEVHSKNIPFWHFTCKNQLLLTSDIDINILKNVIYETLNIGKSQNIFPNFSDIIKNGILRSCDYTIDQYYYIYKYLNDVIPNAPKLQEILDHPIYL